LDSTAELLGSSPDIFRMITIPSKLRTLSIFSQPVSVSPPCSTERASVLNDLIERFLENSKIFPEELELLNDGEQLVLDCLIHRKLERGLEDYIKDNSLCSKSATKTKRLEENYKMVFKSALKHLGNTFKKNKKSKKTKSDDTSFYDHYFGNLASGQGLPIETFFHPNKKMKA